MGGPGKGEPLRWVCSRKCPTSVELEHCWMQLQERHVCVWREVFLEFSMFNGETCRLHCREGSVVLLWSTECLLESCSRLARDLNPGKDLKKNRQSCRERFYHWTLHTPSNRLWLAFDSSIAASRILFLSQIPCPARGVLQNTPPLISSQCRVSLDYSAARRYADPGTNAAPHLYCI